MKKTCIVCGREFATDNARKKSCSRECALKHRRDYQREHHLRRYHTTDGRDRARQAEYARAHRAQANAARNMRTARLREAARRCDEMRDALQRLELYLERLAWRGGMPAAAMEDVREMRDIAAAALRPTTHKAQTQTPVCKAAQTIREVLDIPPCAGGKEGEP